MQHRMHTMYIKDILHEMFSLSSFMTCPGTKINQLVRHLQGRHIRLSGAQAESEDRYP